MTKTVKIVCDQCDRDITCTGNDHDYRILLANESMQVARGQGSVTAMMISPPIKGGSKHFCSYRCLKDWCYDAQ